MAALRESRRVALVGLSLVAVAVLTFRSHTTLSAFIVCKNELFAPSQLQASRTARERRGAVTLRRGLADQSELRFHPVSPTTGTEELQPVLLFLPGIDGSGRLGSQQFTRLSNFFECWALTIPPEDRSSLAVMVARIHEFLSHRRAGKRQVLLLAESMGSVVALAVALRHPEVVDAMCLLNPATSYGQSPISLVAPLMPGIPDSVYRALPAAVTPLFGKLGWYEEVSPAATRQAALPGLGDFARVSQALSKLLPPETLRFREAFLRRSCSRIDFLLQELRAAGEPPAWANRTLLLAGDADLILPSVAETERLAGLIPGASRVVLPGVAHVGFDDTNVNLLLLLTDAGIIEDLARTSVSRPTVLPAAVDLRPGTWLDSALGQARSWVSPVFMSTAPDGTIVRGLQAAVPRTDSAPVLFVGNHQLFSLDGTLIVEEFLRESGKLVTALVYPSLMDDKSPLDPVPYPFPGTAELFKKYQVLPAGAKNLLRALQPNAAALLFPGGAREVFKRKGEDYQLFWPPTADLVRLAARVNATIVPFSGVGSDEFFDGRVLDSDELMALPVLGDWLRKRTKDLPSFVKDDVFVPPLIAPRLQGPRRNYFLFAAPISTSDLDPKDRAACNRTYAQIQRDVKSGISHLLQAREEDPFEQAVTRFPVEQGTGLQAPSFSLDGQWGRFPNFSREA